MEGAGYYPIDLMLFHFVGKPPAKPTGDMIYGIAAACFYL